MKRKSCSFLALFLAFSLFSCTNDNSVNSGSIEPSVSASTTNSGSTSSSGSLASVSTSTKPSTSNSVSASTSSVSTDAVKKAVEKAVTKADLIASGNVTISSKDDWTDESSESLFEFGKDSNGTTLHYTGKEYSEEYDIIY